MAEKLVVGIDVQDNGSPALEKFKRGLKNVQTEINASNGAFGVFGKSLQDNFIGKIPGVSSSLGGLEKALSLVKNPMLQIPIAAGAALVGMIALSNANTQAVHELVLMHDKTGISVNALKALGKVGKESGIGLDQITSATVKMEKNLASNSKELAKFGITSHDPTEAMAQLADAISKTHDPIEKARIGSAALGKSYADMMPMLEKGGDAFRNAAQAASISQTMVNRYEKIHKDQLAINGAVGAWKTALGDVSATVLGPIYDKLAGMASKAKDVAIWLGKAAQQHVTDSNANDALARASKAASGAGDMRSSSTDIMGQVNAITGAAKAKESAYVESLKSTFKALDATSQSELYASIIGKIPKEYERAALSAIAAIKKETIAAEEAGKKTHKGDGEKADNSKSLALAEELFKAKGKLEVDSLHDSTEREKKAAEVEYLDKVHSAEKTYSEIKRKTSQDSKNLEALKALYSQEYAEKVKDIESKAQDEITRKHKEELDKRIKSQEETLKKSQDLQTLAEDAYLSSFSDEGERELAQLILRYQTELSKYSENLEAKKLLEIKYENDRAKLVEKTNKKIQEDTDKRFETVRQYIDASLKSPISNFSKNMLSGNKSAASSFRALGADMKEGFISATSEMVAQYVAKKALMYAEDLAGYAGFTAGTQAISAGAQATSVATATATGAAIETATAPAAATASAASWGGAAVAGAASMLALLALVKSFDVGTRNVERDQLAQIHAGEIILPARQSAAMRQGNYGPAMSFMGHTSQASSGSSFSVNVYNSGVTAKDITRELKHLEKRNKRNFQ